MKRTVLTGALLVFAILGQAQYLDNSMVWTEHYQWVPGGTFSFGQFDYSLTIQEDTVLNGQSYFVVKQQGIEMYQSLLVNPPNFQTAPPVFTVSSNNYAYIREDGTRFYKWAGSGQPDIELYDFGVEVGDSIAGHYISEIDTIEFDGEQRRRYWTLGNDSHPYVAIEGVGYCFGGLLNPGFAAFEAGAVMTCAGTSSMSSPFVLDSTFNCSPYTDYVFEYELPCTAPEDSVHVEAGLNTVFVFNNTTTQTLFFSDTGTYPVQAFHFPSGDSFTIQFEVTPYVPLVQDLLVTGDSLICPGDTLVLCGVPALGHSYSWNTGNTTECVEIPYEWCAAGVYQLYVYDSQGCEYIYNPFNVSCGDSVIANFTWHETMQGIEFDNSSVNGTEYYWDFGDGDTSNLENPVHQFTNGKYDVCLIATNDCMVDTLCETIMLSTGIDAIERKTSLRVRFDGALLNVSSRDRIDRIHMLDGSGRLVLSKAVRGGNHTLNLSEFENAVYFLNVWFESVELETRKLSILN